MSGTRTRVGAFLALAATLVFVTSAAAGGGPSNGDFERGNLTGWSVDSNGPGVWSAYSGNQTPAFGAPIDRPPQGKWAAVAEELGPSQTVLYRTIGLGTGKTQQISFYVYYRNYADGFDDIQFYRVDIQPDGADPFSTNSADILKTLFLTKPGDPNTRGPKLLKFTLTGLSGPVQLRFLVSASSNELNGATDDVRLQSAR
jgi:hypothetical protein